MKRKYIIRGGIVLLLLSGLFAADYYINNYNKLTVENGAAPATATAGADATSNNTGKMDNGIVTDNTVATPLPVTTPTASVVAAKSKHARTSKTKRYNEQTSLIQSAAPNELTACVDDNNQLMASNYAETDIAVEKTKAYFGNKPATETKKQHKGIVLPAGLLGVEAGYSQSAFTGNHTQGMQVGNIMAGVLVNFNVGKHFSVQPGLRYITGGTRVMTMNNENEEKLKLHYLQMPANLVLKFGQPGNTRFMVGATPYVSYLINTKDKFRATAPSEGDYSPQPQYSNASVNKLDYGVGGFVGVQSSEGIFARVGMQYGMADVTKNTGSASSARNSTFFASFGYILGGRQ